MFPATSKYTVHHVDGTTSEHRDVSSACAELAKPAFPQLAAGVSVALLRRVWDATPADRKHQRATLLDSIVRVKVDGYAEAKPLRDLTLAEVERAIGAVTPRFVVRFWQPGKLGTQVATFVELADAERFADDKRLYSRRATVEPLAGKAG